MLVSQSEFARMCGVSRQAVLKWKAAGRLVLQGSQVDVEATDSHMEKYHEGGSPLRRAACQPVDSRLTEQPLVDNPGAPSVLEGEEISIRTGESVEQAAERLIGEVDMNMSFDEARRMKEVYLALLNGLEYEERQGALIDLNEAQTIFFEEFRAARDAWMNWPARVGPIIAAELNIDAGRVTDVLTAHVHRQISQLGEPDPSFARD